MKRCTKCGEMKPESEFYFNRNKRDNLSSWCKECTKKDVTNRNRSKLSMANRKRMLVKCYMTFGLPQAVDGDKGCTLAIIGCAKQGSEECTMVADTCGMLNRFKLADGLHKRCATCGRVKELNYFSKSRRSRDGRQCYCKKCNSEKQKMYYEQRKKKEEAVS